MGPNGRDFLIQSVDQIKENQPFYSFLVTLTSHHPYPIPKHHQKLDTTGISENVMKNYLQAIQYTDAAIGAVIKNYNLKGYGIVLLLFFMGATMRKCWKKVQVMLNLQLVMPINLISINKQIKYRLSLDYLKERFHK